MIGHHLHLAARSIPRAGPFVFISIVGLAIGLGAALLIGLYVYDELSYERWLPNSDRVYLISVRSPDGSMTDRGPSDVGRWVAADYPQFEAVTRLAPNGGFFKRDEHVFSENIVWADANVFDVLRFPVIAGTLAGALDQPNTLVVTRRIAEKYFGRADVVGETLLFNGEPAMKVTAVIENLPSNTHLSIDVLAAGSAGDSPIVEQDAKPMTVVGAKGWMFHTYGLLKRGESIEPLREGIRTLPDRHSERAAGGQAASEIWPLIVTQIRTIHLGARDVASPDTEDYGRLYGAIGIGALIILAAAINFVTLRTALAMRRAVEVGVRKACGGNRRALFAQFMSEVFVHVCVATTLGVALTGAALPALNTFLNRTIEWQTLFRPVFLGGVAALVVTVTLLAGSYPAFVLASFRPSLVTKARTTGRLQSGVRQALVALQFAIVIAVLIATIVVHRQTAFGMRESLRQNSDPTLLLRTRCSDAIKDALSRLPGVKGTACSGYVLQAGVGGVGPVQHKGGERLVLGQIDVDVGYFELYGIELAAGRYFSDDFGADKTPKDGKWTVPESILLNEAGVAKLGIASPQAANRDWLTQVLPVDLERPLAVRVRGHVLGRAHRADRRRRERFPDRHRAPGLLSDHVLRRSAGVRRAEHEARRTCDAGDPRRRRPSLEPDGRPPRAAGALVLRADDTEHLRGPAPRLRAVLGLCERRDPDLGARPRRSRGARRVGAHEGDRRAQGARQRARRDHALADVAVLEAGASRERDRVAGGVSRDEQLAGGLRAADRPRTVDVRRRRARGARGRGADGRRARVGDRGRAAGGGVEARVRRIRGNPR